MTVAPASPHLQHTLEAACRARGIPLEGARLIHHYNNAVYLLPSADAIARVTIGSYGHDAALRAHATVGWLVKQMRFPATAPLLDVDPVDVDESSVVSFWRYYPQDDHPKPDAGDLGTILRQLHDLDGVDSVPVPLPDWRPLASLQRALDTVDQHDVLSDDEWGWLNAEVETATEAVAALDWPLGTGVIHGDAWAGNLLWAPGDGHDGERTAVIGDWDSLAIGPREVDLIPTWHAARRYAKGASWVSAFQKGYDYDLAGWSGFETLFRMRDLMQITGPLRRARRGNVFESALRQRVLGVMHGDDAPWVAL